MPRGDSYQGPERRRFRRLELHYPVRIELNTTSPDVQRSSVEGTTENLSFGGALIGVADASCLRGATPVTVYFSDRASVRPVTQSGVIWDRGGGRADDRIAVEFDAPLLAYEGAVEIADRLQWLRDMGGDDFLRRNIERFLDTAPRAIDAAQEACAAGDLEAVANITRSLKASAGNIGAVNLYEMARRAEQAARAGGAAAASRFVDVLTTYYEAVRSDLESSA
ncbi:MAG: Hpt domain-containing protein [Acidobacteriota bacterium]|jgi:HPt (histidine-containing phosphotransfer) domain-containing protein